MILKRFTKLMVVTLIVAIALLGLDFIRVIYASSITEKPFHFTFEQGQTFKQLSDQLTRAGMISNRYYWQIYAVFQGADRQVKAGTYRIEAQTTLNRLLDDLVSGNTLRYRFTLFEGWTSRLMIESMRKHPQITMESDDLEEIRKHLGIAEASLEGWIYPDTYVFEKGVSNIIILAQGYELMKEKLASAWAERAEALPIKTPYEALILASIIEKETAREEERARIAGVFVSRLQKGIALQTDPTIIYGLGEAFDGDLRREDLKKDSPYNSYTRKGLPPTPIAMPGEKSIRAALNPDITGELYFVSKGDGSHYFSKTYKEHLKAVQRYQLSH